MKELEQLLAQQQLAVVAVLVVPRQLRLQGEGRE